MLQRYHLQRGAPRSGMVPRAMVLFKKRPKVRLNAPNRIHPGDEVKLTVFVDSARAISINSISLTITGIERWTYGESHSQRSVFLHQAGELSDAGELEEGTTTFVTTVHLPETAPPSYNGRAKIEYAVRVEVDIPWWPDRTVVFSIPVTSRPGPAPAPSPQVFTPKVPSSPTAPAAEFSLSSDHVTPGGVITGAFAVSRVEHNRYRHADVTLRANERLHNRSGSFVAQQQGSAYRLRFSLEGAEEGEMVPFRIRLPENLPPDVPRAIRPSGLQPIVVVTWSFEVCIAIWFGSPLVYRVPFRVLPASDLDEVAQGSLEPPQIGSGRVAETWQNVAASLGMTYASQMLTHENEDVRLSIFRDVSEAQLVAQFQYPDLGLDLDARPRGFSDVLYSKGAKSGSDEWDNEYAALGRDEGQVSAFLKLLVPHLGNARVRHWDDERLEIGQTRVPNTTEGLEKFCRSAMTLATTLENIRSQVPAPTGMKDCVPAFEELASRVAGAFFGGDMRVNGDLGGGNVEVMVKFSKKGKPIGTWLRVHSRKEIPEDSRLLWAPYLKVPFEVPYSAEARELSLMIQQGTEHFAVEADQVLIRYPHLLGKPELSAEDAARTLGRMARLSTLLTGAHGPYR